VKNWGLAALDRPTKLTAPACCRCVPDACCAGRPGYDSIIRAASESARKHFGARNVAVHVCHRSTIYLPLLVKGNGPIPQLAFEKYTLPNGLQVVLHEITARHRGREHLVYVARRTSGRTHRVRPLFEHMMFEGTVEVVVRSEAVEPFRRAAAQGPRRLA